MAEEEETAPAPIEEVEMSVLDALKEVRFFWQSSATKILPIAHYCCR